MILVVNKKAYHDFEISSKLQAGVVLEGQEVKSLRQKSGSLKGSFVKVIDNEAFLVNAQITPYKFAQTEDYDPKRTRKLLLKRKEIFELAEVSQRKGWSLIPLSLELVKGKIKLTIGVGRGKKVFEKRAILKKKAQQRDLEKEVKAKVKLN